MYVTGEALIVTHPGIVLKPVIYEAGLPVMAMGKKMPRDVLRFALMRCVWSDRDQDQSNPKDGGERENDMDTNTDMRALIATTCMP